MKDNNHVKGWLNHKDIYCWFWLWMDTSVVCPNFSWEWISGHRHCLLHPVVCKAATNFLHHCLSWTSFVIDPQVCSMALRLLSTVLLHNFLGLPLFLLPSGVQCRAVLVSDWGSFRGTCPIHLHQRFLMMVPMFSWLHLLCSSSFVIFSGQNILGTLRKHGVWNDVIWRDLSL